MAHWPWSFFFYSNSDLVTFFPISFFHNRGDWLVLTLEYLHVNPLTPELLSKNAFFDILEISSQDMDQISSNLRKKAFATWQHACTFLSSSIAFYDICARTCRNQNFQVVFEPASDLRL